MTCIAEHTSALAIDHRARKARALVRSPRYKPRTDDLVVWWVTTCESSLLIVFVFVLLLIFLPACLQASGLFLPDTLLSAERENWTVSGRWLLRAREGLHEYDFLPDLIQARL